MSSPDVAVVPAVTDGKRHLDVTRAILADYLWRARGWLPRGRSLSDETWARRHKAVLILLWLHVPVIFLFALLTVHEPAHAAFETSIVAAAALLAGWGGWSRSMRAVAASFGLVSASAIFVHLSGGYTEAHFHFFVVIGVIVLYQDWLPFLVAIGFVVVHHAVLGVFEPDAVFNNPAARANPLLWAFIHGAFVFAASVVALVSWRFVEQQSLHDPLTGLPNRALFADRLNHALAASARSGRALAVMYLDVDDFKGVNDRLGHAAGDELLQAIATRLRSCLRSADTASRLGGDEFAVLLESLAEPTAAIDVAERIRAAMAAPFPLASIHLDVQLSIGIAIAQLSDTADMIVRGADVAMYAAKREGGGRVRFFDPLVHRRELANSLPMPVRSRPD